MNTSSSLCDGSDTTPMHTPHSLSFMTNNYDLNQPFSYSYGTAIIAHEIGHTLGGRHTFECFWYETTAGIFSIEDGACNSDTESSCVSDCTNSDGTYQPTIMSYCWNFTTSVNYDNPFHREVALNILGNLCGYVSCFTPETCIDADFDGFCENEDCNDNNPTVPALIGAPCDDQLSSTINDEFVFDSNPDVEDGFSCICQGTPWENPPGTDICNLVIGGTLDFEGDFVGAGEGTWYGGLQTGWTTDPGNTPDIGQSNDNGECNSFISFVGSWNQTTNRIGLKEGLAIALSDPIPCNVGQIELSFTYCLVNDNETIDLTGDLITIQGSNMLQNSMPHDCPHPQVVCLGTAAQSNTDCTIANFNGIFNPDPNICTRDLTFCSQTITLTNTANFDLNFIYLSFNVNNSFPQGVHNIFLDDIAINLLPNDSYAGLSAEVDECILESITYSPYCNDYQLQYSDNGEWITIPESEINVVSSTNGIINDFKITTDVLNYQVIDCYKYRIVQSCPPSDEDMSQNCGGFELPLDLSSCNNTVMVDLRQFEPVCAGEEVIVYDSELTDHSAIWSNGDETTIVQNTFSEADPGIYNYSVTVTDNSGCTGVDDIDVEYEDCPPPLLIACGTTVNYRLGDNQQSSLLWWLENRIPHIVSTNSGTTTYTVESLDFWVGGQIEIDIDVVFIDCTFFMSSNFIINGARSVRSHSSVYQPCNSTIGNIFNVLNGGELYFLDNSWMNGSNIHHRGAIGIVYQSDCIISIDNSAFTNWDNCIFPRSGIEQSLFNISNSTFTNSDWCIVSIGDVMNFNDNIISECNRGVELISNAIECTVDGNEIESIRESLNLRFGNYIVTNNALKSSGDGFRSTIRASNSDCTIDNNFVTNTGIASAIYLESCGGTLTQNDIDGGGTLGFYQFPAVYHGGTSANSTTSNNVIIANSGAGIHNVNSAAMNIECNDISAQGSFFSRAISLETGSDNPVIVGNNLTAYRDLYTKSFISDTDHLGNCYNGEAVEAVGISVPTLQTAMLFLVNPNESDCFFPNDVFPQNSDWFLDDPFGTAESCGGLVPGSGGKPFIENEEKICAFLEFLNESLADPDRRQLGIIRLISLFKTIYGADYYKENTIPKCLQKYLDTTSLCGIKMIIDTENMVEDAILGSDTIRLQIQLQATITFLSLQQWQNYDPEAEGNSQSERDQLWEDYITELNILKVLIQTKRTEEDMIWSSIDSIAIEECLDSISMIEMKAYKYMTHIDELSDNEKADIIQYAKRCATQYGHGIHLMRSIASRFDDTDYREYDLDCEESMQDGYRNQEIEYRKSQSGITIVPNPNNGTFSINHSNNLEVTQVTIRDIQGMEVYNQVGVSQGEHIQINVSSGLYIISMEYNNGKIESQKIIISK